LPAPQLGPLICFLFLSDIEQFYYLSDSSFCCNISWVKTVRTVKLTADRHPVQRLRITGGIPPLRLYAFMACT
jgi:hypothetical protein